MEGKTNNLDTFNYKSVTDDAVLRQIIEKVKKEFNITRVSKDLLEKVKFSIEVTRSSFPISNSGFIVDYVMNLLKKDMEPNESSLKHKAIPETGRPKENFATLYQWSVNLTTEQHEEKYVWTPETEALANRLKFTNGNLIAVIGLQGSGKTALKQALETRLINQDHKSVLSFKWGALNEDVFEERFESRTEEYLEEILQRLFSSYDESRALKKLGVSKFALRSFINGEKLKPPQKKAIVTSILRYATKKERKDVERFILLDVIQTRDAILIDFPDYSRENQAQMNKDLNEFAHWWESVVLADPDGIYNQKPNLVIFFQKELFSGHFLFGKFDVIELKPLKPQTMIEILKVNCGSIEPFTREALEYLTGLSNGIMRRFKKYVRICLEHAIQHSCNAITPKLAKSVISVEQLEKDMELELMNVFPRQKELRRYAVIALQLLREKGSIPQSEIAETVFDGNKMKCSRVLDKLEAWDYIQREWESTGKAHRKTVKLRRE